MNTENNTENKKPQTKNLRIMPLGGLNEIGKNMTVFEYDRDIFVIDAGIKFPEDDLLGIDVVIPDFTYLERNMDRVKGIIYTHGHEDHIGATPYILRKMNVPLYGTKLTLGLIKNKLKEHKDLKNVKLYEKKPGEVIKLGQFTIEMIHVSHSIPDAVSLAIKSPAGTVIHTGDFKIDYTPIDGKIIDLTRFAELGKEGVDLLLADSTNVEREGHTMSESTVGKTFEDIFKHSEGRIIVASFASNVHRVQQIINAAMMNNRKVAFSGRSMVNVSNVSMELGYLHLPKEDIIEIHDLARYPDNEVVIITTGSQGEPMSALTRMARKEHRQVTLKEGDTVIISATPIPGNEKSVKKVIDGLYQIGVRVIYESLADVHVSGHACKEELKLIHSLVKPKYFLPVHGEYSHLRQHAILAESLGMNKKNIFILENGDSLEINKTVIKRGKKVPSGRILIDGLGIGDVGNIVLRDRKHLSEDGLIIVVVGLSKENGALISGPDIISRGFIYVKESEDLIKESKAIVLESVKKCNTKSVREWSSIKNSMRDSLRTYVYQKTKRSPMILPIIMEI